MPVAKARVRLAGALVDKALRIALVTSSHLVERDLVTRAIAPWHFGVCGARGHLAADIRKWEYKDLYVYKI